MVSTLPKRLRDRDAPYSRILERLLVARDQRVSLAPVFVECNQAHRPVLGGPCGAVRAAVVHDDDRGNHREQVVQYGGEPVANIVGRDDDGYVAWQMSRGAIVDAHGTLWIFRRLSREKCSIEGLGR